MNRIKCMRSAVAVVASALVAACGGGGDASPSQSGDPVVQGVYGGSLSGSTSTAFQLLMLDGGEYWALYGRPSGSSFLVAGFVQGTGTSSNGAFASSNARDFGFAPSVSGSVSATYTATPSLAGTIANASGSVTFSGGPIAGATYNYNTPAALSTVTGAWSLQAMTGESVSLSIAGSGTFAATTSLGCAFSGSVSPRSSAKNVFDVSLTFGNAPCALPGTSASGVAVAYALTTGGTQLIVAVRDGARTYGTAAFGVR